MKTLLLQIQKLNVRFGGLCALQDVELDVAPGEILGVIGPNGAGKTTLFNVISGIYAPTTGGLMFGGRPLRRPLRRGHMASFGCVAVLCAFLSVLLTANLDRMWAVVIKQHTHQSALGVAEPYDLGEGWRALVGYMQALPHAEQRMGRFHIVSWDGATTFASTRNRDDVPALLAQAVQDSQREAHTTMLVRWGMGLVGGAVGLLASWTVFNQSRRTPTWIARQGIARTFQNNRLFNAMTVLENVQVGLDRHHALSSWQAMPMVGVIGALWAVAVVGLRWHGLGELGCALALGLCALMSVGYAVSLLRWGAFSAKLAHAEGRRVADALELLRFVGLDDAPHAEASSLSYGHQRRLEIARALSTRPQLLLLDEPAAGMNHTETDALMDLIKRIRARGIAVMLIEHDMKLVMGISDRVAVLEYGRLIACGLPDAVRQDPKVIAAYLGEEDAHDAAVLGEASC